MQYKLTELQPPYELSTTQVWSMNDNGEVVGGVSSWDPSDPDPDGGGRAVIWDKNGYPTVLDHSAIGSIAYGINDAGVAVGTRPCFWIADPHAVVWHDGIETDLASQLGAARSVAADANNSGLLVGSCGDSTDASIAFMYESSNGSVTFIDTGPGHNSSAYAVNEQGHVAGIME